MTKFILYSCLLDHASMENAYNICHSVPDLLYVCGFFWEGAGGKGKGRGKDARKKAKRAKNKRRKS